MFRKNKCLIFLVSLIFVFNIFSESFFVQKNKKNKKESASALKEKIGKTHGKIQKEISRLMIDYGNILKDIYDDFKDLLEGEKNSFFVKSKTCDLKNYLDYLSKFKETVKKHRKFLDENSCKLKDKEQFVFQKKTTKVTQNN